MDVLHDYVLLVMFIPFINYNNLGDPDACIPKISNVSSLFLFGLYCGSIDVVIFLGDVKHERS